MHDDETSLDDLEQSALEALEPRFLQALASRDRGALDDAEEALRAILKLEPRLPEPHLELARILLDTERVPAAEPHAREALRHLEAGGQWTDELPENVLQSVAHALLAEVLRRLAESDEVIFGPPDRFEALLAESRQHFAAAAALDPTDATASYYAFFLGPGRGQGAAGPDDA